MKAEILRDLLARKFNVFDFKACESLRDLAVYNSEHNEYTIRFDRNYNYYDLPFYIVDCRLSPSEMVAIRNLANDLNCTLLCSDGHAYDKIQICNFVFIHDKDDFILELNFDKMPLRKMYNENLISIRGNLMQSFNTFEVSGKNRRFISQTFIDRLLSRMLDKPSGRYECTLYPEPVGVLGENIIYWQVE